MKVWSLAVAKLELYGSKHCQYTAELMEELEWQGETFSYFDVDEDANALSRMLALTQNARNVPVLVENGKVKAIGYQGRSCTV